MNIKVNWVTKESSDQYLQDEKMDLFDVAITEALNELHSHIRQRSKFDINSLALAAKKEAEMLKFNTSIPAEFRGYSLALVTGAKIAMYVSESNPPGFFTQALDILNSSSLVCGWEGE